MYNIIVQGLNNNSSERDRGRFTDETSSGWAGPFFLTVCLAFGTDAGSLEMASSRKAGSVDKIFHCVGPGPFPSRGVKEKLNGGLNDTHH